MRYEQARIAPSPSKWFTIDILPLDGDVFAVVMSYGVTNAQKEDSVLQHMCVIHKGTYTEAENIVIAKCQNRERVGYIKIEPKPEQ